MKNWALLGGIIALAGGLSLMLAPMSIAFPSPIDTQQQIGEFGENVQVVITSHTPGHEEPPGPPGKNRVDVCHKGRTITISPDAVPDHLAHGDTLGPC